MHFPINKLGLISLLLYFFAGGCFTSSSVAEQSSSYTFQISNPTNTLVSAAKRPDRIIQSKKVKGRLKKLIWGDYLYAFVTTKKGQITFLINGNESCFLRQYQKEELSINYDVVDRYIPQASGYRRFNIIRQVQSKTTNLATWRKSVTQKELNRCVD